MQCLDSGSVLETMRGPLPHTLESWEMLVRFMVDMDRSENCDWSFATIAFALAMGDGRSSFCWETEGAC